MRRNPTSTRALLVLVGLLAVVLGVRAVVPGATVMRVSSGSMAPTLSRGDRVVVLPAERLHRGDLVVFDDPGGWRAAARRVSDEDVGSVFVKRVVGLPGDHVVCCDPQGRIQVDGHSLDEEYVAAERSRTLLAFDITLGPEELWVLGDNRDASVDSRYLEETPHHGTVAVDHVRGTVRWSF